MGQFSVVDPRCVNYQAVKNVPPKCAFCPYIMDPTCWSRPSDMARHEPDCPMHRQLIVILEDAERASLTPT